MNSAFPSLGFLTFLALAPAVAPQSAPCISEPPIHLPWPGETLVGQPFERDLSIVGDFDGNLTSDAVTVHQGDAVLAVKPAMYNVMIPVSAPGFGKLEDVTGIATSVNDVSAIGDGIVAASPAGLSVWSWDGAAFTATVVPGSSAWIGATQLHSANLDGGIGRDDVFGINAAGTRLLVAYHDGTSFGPTIEHSLPAGVMRDTCALDWQGNGLQELAILTDEGLAILRQDGTAIAYVPFSSTHGAITTIQTPDSVPRQVVAWSRKADSTSPSELVLRNSVKDIGPIGLTFELCPGSGEVVPFALEAADYDLLPGDDLVLAHDGPSNTMIVMRNLGLPPYFSTATSDYDTAVLSSLYGHPGVGQLDDGPQDIVAPDEASGDLLVFTEMAYEFAVPTTSPVTALDIIAAETEWGYELGGSPRQLHLAFTVLPAYQSATHIEIILWHMPDASVQNPTVLEQAVHYKKHALVAHKVDQFVKILDMEDNLEWAQRRAYFTEFRFVQYDGNSLVQASRVFNGGFTVHEDFATGLVLSDYSDLLSLAGTYQSSSDWTYATDSNLLLDPNKDSGEICGLYVPMTRQAPFDDGDIPDPGQLVDGDPATPFIPFD
ncbi:MAG: hypothetical protein AAF682_20970 [Planctomycetota bacterium]